MEQTTDIHNTMNLKDTVLSKEKPDKNIYAAYEVLKLKHYVVHLN